ncbi:GTPase IMAP family member 7-like isoform X1 [Labeo rohita]|uniref:GTPase IMAP family member 7-like isoform X1 n=1 Tax=Labeo rohita TaxID=84645 RepID=A0A498LYY6_LABRO|nr:GTPase IMAP family member 7-like isoform X1 [Labeo rohita]
MATESGWDEHALRAIFHHALSFRDSPSDLESLIDLAIRVDHRLKERQTEREQETVTARPDNIVYPTLDPEEPMQLGATRITPSERTQRMRERGPGAKIGVIPCPISSGLTIQAVISLEQLHQVEVFIDSGAAGNFMDLKCAQDLSLDLLPLQIPLKISAVDGNPLGLGQIHQCTTALQFEPPEKPMCPEPIVPGSRIVAPILWDLESSIRKAQQHQPDPGTLFGSASRDSVYSQLPAFLAEGLCFPEEGCPQSAETGQQTRQTETVRIVILGSSVSENSHVGNFILGRAAFDSEAPPDVVERVAGRLKDRHVIIINSHQLLQTNISDHQITQTVRECVHLSDPGPHVIVLLLKHEPCSAEDQERVEKVLLSFSERVYQHTMVLSTREPTETNDILQKIFQKCANRHFT